MPIDSNNTPPAAGSPPLTGSSPLSLETPPRSAGAGRRAAVFVVFTFAYFLSQFFRHANASVAGQLSGELGLDAAQLGLMTSLFYLVFAAAQVPLGVALDRARASVVTGLLMLVTVAGSLVFSVAGSFGVLALGRSLMGLGLAAVLMGSLKAFGVWFSPRRYAAAAGMLMGLGALGGVLAAAPLAWFSASHGWRSAFQLGAGIALLGALAIIFLGGGRAPAAAGGTSVPVGAGLKYVFGHRRFWHVAPLNFFMTGALMAIQGLWAGPFLIDVLRATQTGAGSILTFLSFGVIAGYLGSGWISERLGLMPTALAAGILFALAQAGLVLMAFWPSAGIIKLAYAALGLAGGFQTLLLVHARSLFPAGLTGRGLTAVNLFGIGGAAVLQWVMGLAINAFGRDAAGRYPPAAYATAFAITALGSLLAVIWYCLMPTAGRPEEAEGLTL